MTDRILSETEVRALAERYSIHIAGNAGEVIDKLLVAIREERNRQSRLFGRTFPDVIEGTEEDWLQSASLYAYKIGAWGLSRQLGEVFTAAKRDTVNAKLYALTHTPPEGVPQDFVLRAVDGEGYNIGIYLFRETDSHYWLPPLEARKERPDLSQGIPKA